MRRANLIKRGDLTKIARAIDKLYALVYKALQCQLSNA